MNVPQNSEIYNGILKRAVGYNSVEEQDEYSLIDGEMTLVKRKVITKDIPPDVSAIKLLLGDCEPETVSRAELERERELLIKEYFSKFNAEKALTQQKTEV